MAETPTMSPAVAAPALAIDAESKVTDPCTLVFFGATGDLMKRMLAPAMYNLALAGELPDTIAIIGVSRTPKSDDEFRSDMKAAVAQFSRSGQPQDPQWSEFAKRLRCIAGDPSDVGLYKQLREVIEAHERDASVPSNRLFYLAIPPSAFTVVVAGLDKAGLGPRDNPGGWSRIIVEKPFGWDLESARALQAEISKVFDESLIYRIDHYLGKEPVQDIMALRFGNVIFEPLWNHRYVESVQITAAETVGVEARGAYYDKAGALRDMIQNHVINLLALVAMEPPVLATASAIRDEKMKVLTAIRPIPHEDVFLVSARGQYGPGTIAGKPVPGYRQEPNVAPDSNTDTYAAVRFKVDNWRWAGVPFYLRSGKRLATKRSEIAVQFRPIPHRLFGEAKDEIEHNVLVMKIQPDEGVSLRFSAKVPGPKMHMRSVYMDFNYKTGFEGVISPPAYERLIGDAMRGDATLFTRWDAVEMAWRKMMPIVERWLGERDPYFPNYAAGGQGPHASDEMLARDGARWRSL